MTLGLEHEGGKHYLRAQMGVTRPRKFTWQPSKGEKAFAWVAIPDHASRPQKGAASRGKLKGQQSSYSRWHGCAITVIALHWPWTRHAGGWFTWDSCVPRKYTEGKTRDWSNVVTFSETLHSLASRSGRPIPENTWKKLRQNKKQGLNQTQCLWGSPVSPFTSK